MLFKNWLFIPCLVNAVLVGMNGQFFGFKAFKFTYIDFGYWILFFSWSYFSCPTHINTYDEGTQTNTRVCTNKPPGACITFRSHIPGNPIVYGWAALGDHCLNPWPFDLISSCFYCDWLQITTWCHLVEDHDSCCNVDLYIFQS